MVAWPVSAFVPDLPLREGTPGYNAAYVRFWFSGGRWVPFRCVDGMGQHRQIEVSIEDCELEGRRAYVLTARRAPERPGVSADLAQFIEVARQKPEAILIADVTGVIAYVNPAFESLTGFRSDDALGHTPRLLSAGRHSRAFYEELWRQLRAGREFHGQFVNRKKSGEVFHADETIRPFVDESGEVTHYVATVRDVSTQVRVSEELEYLAYHDSHTGLANRHLFMQCLRREIAGARRSGVGFALLCLDVDRFKAINDGHGHAAGDALLLAIASRLKQCVREVDTVARLGGDEFAVILVHAMWAEEVQRVADKVLLALGAAVSFEGRELASTVSIGIAMFPVDGGDEHTLLRTADEAMYRAKAGRGNAWRFHEAISQARDGNAMTPQD